jgi:signal transduction histidine kinase
MAGVPIIFGGEVIGILYAANRSPGEVGNRAVTLLSEFSNSISPLIVTAERTERAREVAIQEERQAIAQQLHDTAGQILFNIGLSARALRSRAAEDPSISGSAEGIEFQASQASTYLREALHALSALSAEDALPVAVHRDARAFSDRTGVPIEVIAVGEPFATAAAVDAALLAVVREGLHNIEKHANASCVFLTLFYSPGDVGLVIQDDGRGLPDGFSIQSVAGKARTLGLVNLLQKVQCLGGQLAMTTNEDGGVTLRVNIPVASPEDA